MLILQVPGQPPYPQQRRYLAGEALQLLRTGE